MNVSRIEAYSTSSDKKRTTATPFKCQLSRESQKPGNKNHISVCWRTNLIAPASLHMSKTEKVM